jgi:hypothetical protein
LDWRPRARSLAAIADHFRRVFGALTYNYLEITFEGSEIHAPQPRQSRDAYEPPTSVALLSGGIDSLAGAGLLLSQGSTPFFVYPSMREL